MLLDGSEYPGSESTAGSRTPAMVLSPSGAEGVVASPPSPSFLKQHREEEAPPPPLPPPQFLAALPHYGIVSTHLVQPLATPISPFL